MVSHYYDYACSQAGLRSTLTSPCSNRSRLSRNSWKKANWDEKQERDFISIPSSRIEIEISLQMSCIKLSLSMLHLGMWLSTRWYLIKFVVYVYILVRY